MSNPITGNRKVAIYARVSGEEQREGQTIDSQVTELERFAAQNNWTLIDVYKDDGWTGSVLARPELDRLRDDGSKRKFDAVLINDVDRLARDVSHLSVVKRDMEKHGVQVIFRKLPSDKSPTHNLMVNILGSFAEFEREMIIDRTRRGRRHKVEARQKFIGALAAYGYRYIRIDRTTNKEGYLEIDPEEATVVRQLYEWVDREGLSARAAVKRLNTMSMRAPKGKTWAKSTVMRILRNEMYAGVWYYNKHYSCDPKRPVNRAKYRPSKSSSRLRPRSEWLPVVLPSSLCIVGRQQWGRVQDELTKNRIFSPRNSKHSYLLKGLVRCGNCQATFVGEPCHGRFYYRCHKRCKKLPTISENTLDKTVWDAVSEAVLNPSIIIDQLRQKAGRQKDAAKNLDTQLNEINQALRQVETEEQRIVSAYRQGILSAVHLERELDQLRARKESLDLRQRELSAHANSTLTESAERSVADYCNRIAERLKSFTPLESQRFLRLLIDTVVFEGHQVRIRASIPSNSKSETEQQSCVPSCPPDNVNALGIVPPDIDCSARNSDSEKPLSFCLVKQIGT